jgi:hypothetical protein
MHNPSKVLALADIDAKVKEALSQPAAAAIAINCTALILLPRTSVSKVLWMATLKPASLPSKHRISASFACMAP